MLQYVIKNLLFHVIILILIYYLNLLLTFYFSQIIIFTFWGCSTIWILSDTFIILKDLNFITDKYNNLKNQNDIILKEYSLFLKNKHDEIIVIHKVLLEYVEILNNINNDIEEIKNEIIYKYNNDNNDNKNNKNKFKLSKYLNSYSCTF